MSTGHWFARGAAEAERYGRLRRAAELARDPLERPAAPGGAARLRADASALLADLRRGWTARCLVLTAAYVGAAYAVAAWAALPLHWPLAYLLRQAETVLLITYLPLLAAFFAGGLGGPRGRAAGLRAHLFSPRFVVELAAAMLAVHVTLIAFVNLKQYVPALNERLWDSPLWRLDEKLHLGVAPAAVAHELAASSGLLPLLDRAYLLYFPAQVAVPLLFLLAARLRPRRGQFFFAYCLLWMAGSLAYVLWPALGPGYYRPSRFGWLELAPYAKHLQEVLIRGYVRFRSDPAYYQVKPHYGVAALPSLHLAVLALFAIATRGWRAVSISLWVLTAVTFIGSLALAWHYAVDGYSGVALAWGCWWGAGRAVGPVREAVPVGGPLDPAPIGARAS